MQGFVGNTTNIVVVVSCVFLVQGTSIKNASKIILVIMLAPVRWILNIRHDPKDLKFRNSGTTVYSIRRSCRILSISSI